MPKILSEKKYFKQINEEDLFREIDKNYKYDKNKTMLFDYQLKELENSKKNFLYPMDTGTGKTYMGIYHFLKYTNNTKKLLIVSTASKILSLDWLFEVRKIELYHNIKIDVSQTTYGKLRTMALDYESLKDTFILFDECHNAKSISSQQGEVAKKLCHIAYGFCLLSATPTPQGIEDMLNYFLMNKTIDNVWKFRRTYGIFTKIKQRYTGKNVEVLTGWKNQDYIMSLYNSFTGKALKKSDCLDLPDLVEKEIYFKTNKEYNCLNVILKELKLSERIKNGLNPKENIDITNLTSSSNNNLYLDFKKFEKYNNEKVGFDIYKINSVAKLMMALRMYTNIIDKLNYLDDFISNTNNNTVIFYNFNKEYTLLKEMLEKHSKKDNFDVYSVNGELKQIPSESEKQNGKQKIILVQLKAGNSALNFQYCTEVFYVTLDYSYSNWQQSLGRAYRLGQKNKVTVYYLLTENTFDTKVLKALIDKDKINKEIENSKTNEKFIDKINMFDLLD